MTGHRTAVTTPHGGVHTGSGHQINFVTWMLGADERLLRAGTARLTVVREQRRRLLGCFVPPRYYGKAADRLQPRGSVILLDGPPGLGRRAAATMLLEEAPGAVRPVEELPATREEGTFEVSADDRYLLDLSSVTDADYPAAERALTHYRSVVEQGDARLVVVLPAALGWMLHEDLSSLVVPLGRPRGRTVFSRHLRAREVPFDPDDLDTEALRHLFASAPMRELARLAELVAEARDSKRYGASFRTWCAEAVAAATNWAEEVTRQLREHRGPNERALLLAAAMVSDAPAEAALKGARLLLEVLGHGTEEDPVGIARPGLGEQLEQLGIERDEGGRIAFRRLAYDSAVRRHFWTNFPDLRPAFRDWVARCNEMPELRAKSRMDLIARFAVQAMATGCPEHVCALVEAWTRPQGGRFRAEAAAALELGLSHERYGSYFRSHVYSWVTGRISSELAHVLTDVCRQVIAATHPEQAAVRLRYLALRRTGAEAAARAALLDLARTDPRVYRRLIDRIAVFPLAEGAADLLLGLLDPVPLRIAPPYQEFALGWQALMTARPAAEWTPVLHRWLDRVSHGPLDRRLAGSLIVAAAGDYGALNRLYVAVCGWAASSPVAAADTAHASPGARQRVGELFCREIDALLGMGAVDSTAAVREGGVRI